MSCVSPRQRGRFSPCRRLGSRHQLYGHLCQLTCHLASIMVTGAWPTAARLCSVVRVCSHTILSPLSVTASQSERHVAPPVPHAPWGCSGIPTEFQSQSQTICQLKHGHTGTHTQRPAVCCPGSRPPRLARRGPVMTLGVALALPPIPRTQHGCERPCQGPGSGTHAWRPTIASWMSSIFPTASPWFSLPSAHLLSVNMTHGQMSACRGLCAKPQTHAPVPLSPRPEWQPHLHVPLRVPRWSRAQSGSSHIHLSEGPGTVPGLGSLGMRWFRGAWGRRAVGFAARQDCGSWAYADPGTKRAQLLCAQGGGGQHCGRPSRDQRRTGAGGRTVRAWTVGTLTSDQYQGLKALAHCVDA